MLEVSKASAFAGHERNEVCSVTPAYLLALALEPFVNQPKVSSILENWDVLLALTGTGSYEIM